MSRNMLKKQLKQKNYQEQRNILFFKDIGGSFSTNDFLMILYNFIETYSNSLLAAISIVQYRSDYFCSKAINKCFDSENAIVEYFKFEKRILSLIRGYIDSKSDFNKRIYLLQITSLVTASVPIFNILSEYLGSVSNTFIYRNIVVKDRLLSIVNPSLKRNNRPLYEMIIKNFSYINKFFTQYYSLFLKKYSLQDNVYGFVKNRSCVDNATYHLNNTPESLINIDINKFFNNCTILKTIQNNVYSDTINEFDIPAPIKKAFHFMIISFFSYLTHNSVYPTGSSFTPVLSNIIMLPIDLEIIDYLSSFSEVRYSRYADDISISSRYQKINNKNVLNIHTVNDVEKILNKYSFYIKYNKTKIFSSGDSKVINGIALDIKNNKLSIGSIKKLELRQRYIQMKNSDFLDFSLLGLLSYISDVSPSQYKYITGDI